MNLKKYLRTPRLTREEESQLILRWQQRGDERAKEELVLRHMYLVHNKAIRFAHPERQDYEDLLSEGFVGLMETLAKFSFDFEVRFAAYAQSWIDKNVREFRRRRSAVYIPTHHMEGMAAVNRTVASLEKLNGSVPSNQEVARLTGISRERVGQLRQIARIGTMSGNQALSVNSEGDERTLFDKLANSQTIDPETAFFAKQELEASLAVMSEILEQIRTNPKVCGKKFEIITHFFGLDRTRGPMTDECLSHEYSITRGEVHRIVAQAFAKIRVSEGRLSEKIFRELVHKTRSLEELLGV
jgi:DNA-directed RNA polymerase sigma subunit (sigma70/sigma32)